MTQFFGKYRGKVMNNVDPMMMARLQVSAPAVLGDGMLSWAMPSSPFAGPGVGFFALPPVGANLWVEFEGGDPDYPIWSGCFWGAGEVPVMPAIEQMKVFKTMGITITINDLPGAGGFTLEVAPPAVAMPLKMVFDSKGIELNAAPGVVKITPTAIELESPPAKAKLSPSGIELESAPSKAKLAAGGLELENTTAKAKFSSAGVELANAPAEIKLTSAGIEIKNGGASVKLDAAAVKLNDGALEVV